MLCLSGFALCSRWVPLVDLFVSFAEHTLFDIMHKGDIQKRHRKTDFTLLAE